MRNRARAAARALRDMGAQDAMASIAVAAIITLFLAPVLGHGLPSKEVFLVFTVAMFLILSVVVSVVANTILTRVRAHKAEAPTSPRSRG